MLEYIFFLFIFFMYILIVCIYDCGIVNEVKMDEDVVDHIILVDESIPSKPDVMCTICLQENTDLKLPCTHCFHEKCLETWWFYKNL